MSFGGFMNTLIPNKAQFIEVSYSRLNTRFKCILWRQFAMVFTVDGTGDASCFTDDMLSFEGHCNTLRKLFQETNDAEKAIEIFNSNKPRRDLLLNFRMNSSDKEGNLLIKVDQNTGARIYRTNKGKFYFYDQGRREFDSLGEAERSCRSLYYASR
jgi:hypothetical protein